MRPTTRVISGILIALAGAAAWPVAAHIPISTKVTWNKEIIRIFRKSCTDCHREGGAAFSLEKFEQSWAWSKACRDEVLEHHMPPWPAAKGYGVFQNDRALTSWEVDLIVSWAEGGVPRGDPKDLPPPASPETAKPDLLLRPGEVLRKPLQVSALEVHPSTSKEVWLETGKSRVFLGSWLPPGDKVKAALYLPAGSRVTAPIGVYLGSAQKTPQSLTLHSSVPLDRAVHVLAVRPMADDGASIEIRAMLPDGSRQTLVWVQSFVKQYPYTYWLKDPLALPAGTRLEARGPAHPAAELIFTP